MLRALDVESSAFFVILKTFSVSNRGLNVIIDSV